MDHLRPSILVVATVLTGVTIARSGDTASARMLLERAVKAHGGWRLLEKYPAMSAKLKGTFHGMGEAIPFTGETAAEGPARQKLVIDMKVEGQKVRLVTVLNGGKAWMKVNDDTEDLEDEDLAEAQHEAYVDWVVSLTPLKDKAFRLTPLAETKIDKRPAVGVKVSKRGKGAVLLYFDKETGLLAKSETRIRDDDGNEVTEETFWSSYKDVQGTKQAARFTTKRGGKLYMEAEASDHRLAERLDDAVFARP